MSNVPAPGTLLVAKYVVERTIGAGGMGVVVGATHVHLRESVAIKLLHPEIAGRPGAIDRFLREARVAMRLRGEHIVRVHDVGTLENGAPFIVMEHLRGSDLRTLLERRGRLPVSEAVDALLQACEALAEAHAIGVVHRDLKPANLFLTLSVDGSPSIKVLDFGVSKVLAGSSSGSSSDDLDPTAPSSDSFLSVTSDRRDASHEDAPACLAVEASNSATRSQAILGSPRYMAPEQIRSARDVDARADIWSLGVIAYELVSGQRPFNAATLEDLRAAILKDTPRPWPASISVPRAFAQAIGVCLAKERSNRYPDVLALAKILAPYGGEDAHASVARIARIVRNRSRHPDAIENGEKMRGAIGSAMAIARRNAVRVGLAFLAAGIAFAFAWRPWSSFARETTINSATILLAPSVHAVDPVTVEPILATAALRDQATVPSAPPPPSKPRPPVPSVMRIAPPRKAPAPPSLAPSSRSAKDPLGIDGGFLFDDPH